MRFLIILNGTLSTDINILIHLIDPSIVIDKVHSKSIDEKTDILIKTRFYDSIIILGGQQSLVDRNSNDYPHPYLNKLIEMVRVWIDMDIPVMGICLGAQIIGCSLDNPICHLDKQQSCYENSFFFNHDDMFFDQNVRCCLKYCLCLHNDYIKLSHNIVCVASGIAGNQQIPYIIKYKNSYGFQFHPEITPNILIKYCKEFHPNDLLTEYCSNHQTDIQNSSIILLSRWITFVKQLILTS
jgi:GMP synthase-like glutamine amidotransferase